MISVGIIGVGFVGGAILQSFIEHKICVIPYDKYKNIGNFEDILDTDILFLCLPTLYNVDIAEYDKSAIFEVCGLLNKYQYQGIIINKSTVEPGVTQKLAEEYDLILLHNPEFLTARTAYHDFHNQTHIVIGSTSKSNKSHISIVENFYKLYYPSAEITIISSDESESVKLFCNCFYSVKIQFFNELYLLCQKKNIDFNKIKKTMLKNNWINPMHTEVPGNDKQLSYGGMCFPKDTNALLSFMKKNSSYCEVLDATVSERNKLRSD